MQLCRSGVFTSRVRPFATGTAITRSSRPAARRTSRSVPLPPRAEAVLDALSGAPPEVRSLHRMRKTRRSLLVHSPISCPPALPVARPLSSLSSSPPLSRQALIAGGAVVMAALGGIIWGVTTQGGAAGAGEPAAAAAPAAAPLPRDNAVLVFGASGRMGREIVAELLQAGRTVVAAARSEDKARAALEEGLGLRPGRQPGGGILFVEAGVDVTDPGTLTQALFRGVTQVVLSTGAVFGR